MNPSQSTYKMAESSKSQLKKVVDSSEKNSSKEKTKPSQPSKHILQEGDFDKYLVFGKVNLESED